MSSIWLLGWERERHKTLLTHCVDKNLSQGRREGNSLEPTLTRESIGRNSSGGDANAPSLLKGKWLADGPVCQDIFSVHGYG